eukprot:1496289-Rhodomonas_salina.1
MHKHLAQRHTCAVDARGCHAGAAATRPETWLRGADWAPACPALRGRLVCWRPLLQAHTSRASRCRPVPPHALSSRAFHQPVPPQPSALGLRARQESRPRPLAAGPQGLAPAQARQRPCPSGLVALIMTRCCAPLLPVTRPSLRALPVPLCRASRALSDRDCPPPSRSEALWA